MKGFCAEELNVSEETEGEGATEFVDTEGGGFDEGTGATNVSKDCQDLQEQVITLKLIPRCIDMGNAVYSNPDTPVY